MSKSGSSKKQRKPRQVVQMHDDFPRCCVKCSATELTDKRNSTEKQEHFERDGVTYTHARRFYGTCVGCGQTRAVCRRVRRVNA